jgi:hypothetical protein
VCVFNLLSREKKKKNRVVDQDPYPDPDSLNLYIGIRIGNPDPGSVSRGKKIKKF